MQIAATLRFTPAGVPALDCMLVHASMQTEAGGERRSHASCPPWRSASRDGAGGRRPGRTARCRGFLARRYRTGITVALHVNEFELTA